MADAINSRIEVFNPDGSYKTQFGTQGSGEGQLTYPVDVALDQAGNIYVADFFNNRIEVFNPDGNYLTQIDSTTEGGGQFSSPVGVTVTPNGRMYVTGNNLISIWSTPVAPLTPININATAPSTTTAHITWQAAQASAAATSYTIQYRVKGTSTWKTMSVPATQTSSDVTGLDPNTTYEFQILAVNANGQSTPTPTFTVTTPANAVAAVIGNVVRGSGSLADTGANAWVYVVLASMLVAVAGFAVRKQRRI